MYLRGHPPRRSGLEGDIKDECEDERDQDRPPLGLHLRDLKLQRFRVERRSVYAAVQDGEEKSKHAESGKESRKVLWPQPNDDERTDHRAHAVAGVADAQSMRPSLQRRAREQRVEADVERAEAKSDQKDAGQ